ncbi:MAG TPA: glycoside hydrolase family 43 protein, partial [Bryobacteraceae bacterium]|nr:glycoside hydrolase family 43 protein [Bryobacteraceae bacterium]
AVGTRAAEEQGDAGGRVLQMLRSVDLATWTPMGSALTALTPGKGDAYWAPEVAFADGRFWLYYSVGRGDKAHHIRVAVSKTPDGPYEDCGARVTSPYEIPFAIDASPFQDDDGQWYLFYARDFLDTERPGTVVVVDRMVDMTRLAGEPVVVARAQHEWQRFVSNRVMYGGVYDWHTIEGPCVRKHDARYYCFFSAGRWENESYGVDYAVADHPMGPWACDSNDDGARVLRTIPGELIGPGHNSITQSSDGATDYIVYHAWDAGMTARRIFLNPVVWTPEGPRVTAGVGR